MKISCQSCQAKYTIADEKVLGKIVKIRCKKCGATIVINGNDPESAHAAAGGGEAAAEQDQWTVNVADGDQRTMTVEEIVQEFKSGLVNEETFCWKDGMNDWLPLREIDALYSAVAQAGGGAGADYGAPGDDYGAGGGYEPQQQEPLAAAGGFGTDLFGGGGSHANGNGANLFGSSPPPAGGGAIARRTGGRGNNQADLFGGVATAGGEEDVMTSAPVAPGPGDVSKLTGQRNENSVLFSLNALTSTSTGPAAKEENRTTAQGDGSGLIDIRALSATMGGDSGPKSNRHVDDIMNLGGGGAFSAALAAPVLAPPPADAIDYSGVGSPPPQSNKSLLYAIIAGCGLIGVAIIVAVVLMQPAAKDDTRADLSPPINDGIATAMPSTPPPPAPTETSGETASAPGTPTAKEITPGVAAHKATGGGSKAGGSKSAGGGTNSGGGEAVAAAAADPPAAAPAKTKSLQEAMGSSVGASKSETTHAAPSGGTAPFDRGAAQAAIGGVNVASCKKADGPTGSGHVKITFQPSGSVSTVEVDTPPYSGTSVGGCVAAKYRAVHIPAFSGGPVTVGKSFSIN